MLEDKVSEENVGVMSSYSIFWPWSLGIAKYHKGNSGKHREQRWSKAAQAGTSFWHPKKLLQQLKISSDGPVESQHCRDAAMFELGWDTGYLTLGCHSQQKAILSPPLWGDLCVKPWGQREVAALYFCSQRGSSQQTSSNSLGGCQTLQPPPATVYDAMHVHAFPA